MNVEIFAVNIAAQLNQSVDDWLKYFSVERWEKILSYRFNADRNRTLWAELLVRHIIAEKFSWYIGRWKKVISNSRAMKTSCKLTAKKFLAGQAKSLVKIFSWVTAQRSEFVLLYQDFRGGVLMGKKLPELVTQPFSIIPQTSRPPTSSSL